jgi:Domain of unknown function (DUF4760)
VSSETWTNWHFWEQVAKVAPLATSLIALVAATIAIVSLRTQVGIARKRAAIDVFLKTEMDQAMLTAYRAYEEALLASRNYASADEFSKSAPDQYMAIRLYLDVNELICIGINNKVFDQRVCYGFWYTILDVAATEGKQVIQHARQPGDFGHTYDHLLNVHRRWTGTSWPWQRWRR